MTDWRLPENRREAFMRQYLLHMRHHVTSGCAASLLPALADMFELDAAGRAWLVWLNGNTQNPATTLLLLDASEGDPRNWRDAVALWERNWAALDWDTDRKHQKAAFGVATEQWSRTMAAEAADTWQSLTSGDAGVEYCLRHPYVGKVSARFMYGYARLMFPSLPDVETLELGRDRSWTARNGLALAAGDPLERAYDRTPGSLAELLDLELFAYQLLEDAAARQPGTPLTVLGLESACCTFNGWHKPNRRYPGVYADAAYLRLRKAEQAWGPQFDALWEARQRDLPQFLRTEDQPGRVEADTLRLDPRLMNQYRLTGLVPVLGHLYPDMEEGL